ncbi:BT_3987 domain-containing protein [Sphingobacterium spiritivorum]|uniref:BT_3987 domain-containing protein n=1 Tax=Sphingobacterium spiritivorum TaxID=258 RepID=UPI003DA657D1
MKNYIIKAMCNSLIVGLIFTLILTSCNKNTVTLPDPYDVYADMKTSGFLVNSENNQNTVQFNVIKKNTGISIDKDQLNLNFKISAPVAMDITGKVSVNETLVTSYNTDHQTSYQLLPANTYVLSENTAVSISKGNTLSNAVSLKMTNLNSLVLGQTYLLPVSLSSVSDASLSVHESFKTTYLMVKVDANEFPNTDKPNGIKSVLYVETGSNSILNAGRYVMKSSGKPFFDMAILFAPNIGWKDKKPVVTLGSAYDQLNDTEKYIRPLQRKGIKVLVSFLGAMQNYNMEEIEKISLQIKQIVVRYGLDGINFDDEYQSYNGIEMPVANNYSYTMLIKRCKELMPDKIVSFYNIGTTPQVANGVTPGDYLDYAWQAYYGSYYAPSVPGLTDKKKLGPGAAWIPAAGGQGGNVTDVNTAENIARRTIQDGYGVMVFYDLTATAQMTWMERVGKALYNEDVITVEDPYRL